MTESVTILVLDDDQIFSEVLTRSLKKRGYHVLTANSPAAAMVMATQEPPTHAIVDLKLEQDSGLDYIAPLVALNPELRLLVLTGYSSIATAVTAIKLGAHDYACKPLDSDAILQKLGLTETVNAIAQLPEQPPSVDRLEWEHIQRVLGENNGNISATARSLGMHRRTLQRKLQKRPVKQ